MKSLKIKSLACVVFIIATFFVSSCTDTGKEIGAGENAFSFAFLTDIHLQPERNAPAGFRQAIDTVNMLNPDFVIMGGDQIMDALGQTESRSDSLYDMYIEMSGLLNMPVYNT
ncbi:MAG: hypothetical protein KFF49_06440, partial [Bacteroidales bacterium]|nr:hypothetical protein [Bacteroidales bacterium]